VTARIDPIERLLRILWGYEKRPPRVVEVAS
jgi:hypothetical protein